MLTRNPARFDKPVRPPMTRAPGTRVLVDLSHAAAGYVGVAQDLRMIFGMLAGLSGVETSGLLMPTSRHDLPRLRAGRRDLTAMTAAILHCMERNWAGPDRRPFPLAVAQAAQIARQLLARRHEVVPVPDGAQLHSLWRVLFAPTLAPSCKDLVLGQHFFATDLSVSGIIDRAVHLRLPGRKYLAADGFDAVLFSMPRPVRLPRGVRQVMRYHDSVPVTDVDTVVSWKLAMAHSRLVQACDEDAIFVCNSPQSRVDLISLDPRREEHAVVIPCALAEAQTVPGGDPVLAMGRAMTFRALGGAENAPPSGWAPPQAGMRYVMAVSTLEPRKNYCSLIRAWERVVLRSDPDLKLVIVGGHGWREEQVLAQLRPGVARGGIYHLQSVPPDDLHTLMRHAAAFASVSYNEGFGYSALEATQAGAPCLISDIPVFRWIFGDAAVYVDPYDVESIASGIERLVCGPQSGELARALRSRAEPVLARFRPGAIAQAWEALLEPLGQRASV